MTIRAASRYAALIVCVLGASGCVSVATNYSPETTDISEPPLNAVNTAYVGDSMLRQGQFTLHDAMLLHADVDVGILNPYTLKRGYYLKRGEDEQSEFYQPSRYPGGGAIEKAALADPPKAVQASKVGTKLCVVTIFNAAACTNHAEFERAKQPAATANSFQQTLIYSGRVGNKIKAGYREYSNNLARPAFNNDVEYDLTETRVIGYKGARIEVLDATNEYIRYKVIQNFNRATY